VQELLSQSVRELESMQNLALELAKKEQSDGVSVEEIAKHFTKAIEIKTQELWSNLASCNESLTTAKNESEHEKAYNTLKNFLDSNVLFFSEGSEDFKKFQMIYESFYSALNEMEGEVSESAVQEAIESMLNDIKKMDNLDDIANLKNAVNSLEDIYVKNILLKAIKERESEL